MKISTTKYNEVDPAELDKLFLAGAKLIKSELANGVALGSFNINGNRTIVYSDDNIGINNVVLPLATKGNTFDCIIEIN